MKQKLFLLNLTFIALMSCNSTHKITNDELKQVIIEKYKNLKITLQNGDPTYVLDMHTNDAVLFKANGTEVTGKNELNAFYKQVATYHLTIESTPISVEMLSDDTAFEFGVFNSTATNGKKKFAKYMNIWKRVGKGWKIFKAIDHSTIKKME
jgi:uncharacterized protein (TIGR02246 family)